LAGLAAALGQLVVAQGRRRGSPYAASRALLALLRGARLELRGAARGVTFKGRLVGLQPLARLATADHRAYLGALAARFGGAARGGRARARLLAPYARALAWGRRGRGLLAAAAGSLTPLVLHAVRRRRLGPLTREAVVKIDHLRMAATMYYRRVVAKRGRKRGVFPRGTWTWTPARRCCAQPGGVCRPRRGDWRGKEWRQLGFAIRQPHRYQYRIRGRGRGTGALFEVEARGDLDCDGHYSSYKMEVYFLVSADGLFPRGPMTRDALE